MPVQEQSQTELEAEGFCFFFFDPDMVTGNRCVHAAHDKCDRGVCLESV